MQVVRHQDPRRFSERVEGYLRGDEPRHNLMLGLTNTLIQKPGRYPVFHLWTIEHEGRLVGVALRTEPHNVVIAAPAAEGVVEALVDGLLAEGTEVPGVVGALPEADVFAARFLAATGASVSMRMDQAIHVLDHVAEVPRPDGAPRSARPEDLDLLVAWMGAFHAEAMPAERYDAEEMRTGLETLLAAPGEGPYHLWDDPGPVCLVGAHDTAPGTPRIGPVYTPPAHRGKGYGTALTAHVSREQLRSGARFCLLYTDLANPTSNAIYARIGYRRVCDSAMILFHRA